MSFTTKKVKTQTLGEYLQMCRKRCGLPLAEICNLAQVNPKYLVALEEERFTDLPAQVYVRGFLRSLAKVYRVPEFELLQQFGSEFELFNRLQDLELVVLKPKFTLPRFIFSPKTAAILGAGFLGLLSLAYLYFQVSSLTRPPKLEIFLPDDDGVVNSSLLQVRGKTEAGSVVYFNNQPIVADVHGEFRENLSLGPGLNQLVIKAVNKFGQEAKVTRSFLLVEKEIAGITTAEGKIELKLLIGPEAAWIHLETDGVEKYSGTMLLGAKTVVSARNKIILTTGNAGSTRVILDGKDLGVLGKEGEVIRNIEFTK